MAEDVHNYTERVQSALDNILENPDISQENKDDAESFYRWMRTVKEMSASRMMRYLQSAKKVLEHNDLHLREASEDDIREINRQIQDSEYYHKEYSAETKGEYKKFVRAYFKCFHDKDEVPEKADWINAHVSESVKDRYKPSELPGPETIKRVCQEVGNLRDKALVLTHWDLGARVGETLATRVKDFYEEDGKWFIHVRGNKDSPNREVRVKLAAPAIQRWLEHGHPSPEEDDAYLFCKIREKNLDGDTEMPFEHAGYPHFKDQLNRIENRLDLGVDLSTHNIRRGRFSYLDKKGVGEKMIDVRHGHVVGSDSTRAYSRLGDEDANRAYGEAYGEEDNGNELEPDLLPMKCQDCGEVNAGFRDRCFSCQELLEEVWERETVAVNERTEEMRELMRELMREEGLLAAEN